MWKSKIISCFGAADMRFAKHPSEVECAKEMIKAAKAEGATLDDVQGQCILHVYKRVSSPQSMKDLMDMAVKETDRLWQLKRL